ncbi:hypothetical protein ES703_96970 [subsurface metagenome]
MDLIPLEALNGVIGLGWVLLIVDYLPEKALPVAIWIIGQVGQRRVVGGAAGRFEVD